MKFYFQYDFFAGNILIFFLLRFLCIFKNACGKNPRCRNNAICQSGFTDKGYKCSCTPGFLGEHCELQGTYTHFSSVRIIGILVFFWPVYELSSACAVNKPFLKILWTVIRTRVFDILVFIIILVACLRFSLCYEVLIVHLLLYRYLHGNHWFFSCYCSVLPSINKSDDDNDEKPMR